MAEYSLPVRMRRVTTETAFVSVPLTDDILLPVAVDAGHAAVNPVKLIEAAIALGRQDTVVWEKEGEPAVEPHPIQTAPPGER